MPTVRLTETHIRGRYQGSDGGIYTRVEGAEGQCSRCREWAQSLYHRSDERVCGRHVRLITRTRIRFTTTFACRVYRGDVAELPPGTVVRRRDELDVAGRPVRHGAFDKFVLPGGRGFVLVPRSRWAWV
ncbi:MAG: hypothetical protein JWO38_3086 [Gemmataceae bacterium]|nr:hypothetical protein [Gemmataceae bacterium]